MGDQPQPSLLKELQELLNAPGLASLGPQARPATQPVADLDKKLRSLPDAAHLSTHQIELIRGAILLWHDHLDEAHAIAQEIEDPDGSLLHGIMHRREPDYGNAKYWFRRVGQHPSFGIIARRAMEKSLTASLGGQLFSAGKWDPFAFVDACERAARHSLSTTETHALQQLQQVETEAFLESLLKLGR